MSTGEYVWKPSTRAWRTMPIITLRGFTDHKAAHHVFPFICAAPLRPREGARVPVRIRRGFALFFFCLRGDCFSLSEDLLADRQGEKQKNRETDRPRQIARQRKLCALTIAAIVSSSSTAFHRVRVWSGGEHHKNKKTKWTKEHHVNMHSTVCKTNQTDEKCSWIQTQTWIIEEKKGLSVWLHCGGFLLFVLPPRGQKL